MVADLFDHVKRSVVSNQIIFTGYLSDNELRHLYSACTVFVYPSLYEGFGLPPIEAMACGAPVIASNIPSIEEVLGTAARLVDPADEEGLAVAIEELLANPAKRSELSDKGLARAATFSWEATVEKLREVYKEAIERDAKTKNPALDRLK
jgi:glycosyltransferase involved in cell wall biosynthesis